MSQTPSPAVMLDDDWLDQEPQSEQQKKLSGLWYEFMHQPFTWLRHLVTFLRSTPGKMTSLVIVVSLSILAAGLSMSQSSAERRADLDSLISNTEPVSHTAHNLYTSLSLADTSATVGFVRSGSAVESARESYNHNVQEAARSAALTSSGLESDAAMDYLVTINQLLPVYTGLVDTAWSNNRQGNPVGAAYMSEANALMRLQILPAANELYRLTSEDVTNSQNRLATPQWVPISGLFAALIFLVLAQVWLARTTHRRLNRGFLAATVFMAIATVWVTMASIITWQAGSNAFEEAARPLEKVTSARIMAQQARTNETLALVLRQAQDSSQTTFPSAQVAVRDALIAFEESVLADDNTNRENVVEARTAMDQWTRNHDRLLDELGAGNYERAVELALGEDGEQTQYAVLDNELAALASQARETLRSYMGQGAAASQFVNIAVLVLSLLAVLAVWIGIRPRLQEYL